MVIGDHPREYGENDYIFGNLDIIGGSSPRIRGECTPKRKLMGWRGIIPANTGRILCLLCCRDSEWDHPREYEENFSCHLMHPRPTGSSPRIRGESFVDDTGKVDVGIIPANTGRMTHPTPGGAPPPDHPREYGENQATATFDGQFQGSSPRIRGESARY